jgi:dCMP deaminase
MRPSRDEWGLELAEVTAKRATCLRRSVGCVLVDRHGHVLATGYNGVAAGQPHCNEEKIIFEKYYPEDKNGIAAPKPSSRKIIFPNACPGANSLSGTNLDACHAIHAEQNALLQCKDVQAIDTCYVTCTPCITCLKLLLNTSCERIVARVLYSHEDGLDLWVKAGRVWNVIPKT